MPVVSGGGSGSTTAQVAASGKVLPVANATGVIVDSTIYHDLIKGYGFLTTLVFPSDQGALAIAGYGDDYPRWLMGAEADQSGFFFGNGTVEPTGPSGCYFGYGSGPRMLVGGSVQLAFAVGPSQAPRISQLSPIFTITDGALPTLQLVSGTGTLNPTSTTNLRRDIEAITPCTVNPGGATIATVTVAISPDNTTYSTLGVETVPVGVALDATIHLVKAGVS